MLSTSIVEQEKTNSSQNTQPLNKKSLIIKAILVFLLTPFAAFFMFLFSAFLLCGFSDSCNASPQDEIRTLMIIWIVLTGIPLPSLWYLQKAYPKLKLLFYLNILLVGVVALGFLITIILMG